MKTTDPPYNSMLREFLGNTCPMLTKSLVGSTAPNLMIYLWNSGVEGHCEAKCKNRSVDYYCEHPMHPRNIPLEDVVLEEL